jgi:hypothetical protein
MNYSLFVVLDKNKKTEIQYHSLPVGHWWTLIEAWALPLTACQVYNTETDFYVISLTPCGILNNSAVKSLDTMWLTACWPQVEIRSVGHLMIWDKKAQYHILPISDRAKWHFLSGIFHHLHPVSQEMHEILLPSQ